MYEDSIELQQFFMRKRDELCKNGEILLTPALSYTELHLHKALEVERRERTPKVGLSLAHTALHTLAGKPILSRTEHPKVFVMK